MKKSLLITMMAVLIAPAAWAADPVQQDNAEVKYKDDGGYTAEKNAEQIDSNGVEHKVESKTEVDYDANGNIKKTIVNSDKVGKGILHSREDQSKSQYQQTNDGGYTKTTTTEHTNSDGTNLKIISRTHASVDANGNDMTVTTTQNTIDPPGLMNQTTSTATTKTVNGVTVEGQPKN